VHVYILEKSDKTKDWYFASVFSSMFTSCIRMSPLFSRPDIDRPWGDWLKEKALLWRSFKHLGSQTLIDQGEASIKGVTLTWLWEKCKAKIEVFNFVSSILTSCIVMSTIFGRLGVDRPWCDPLKEEILLWRSFKHLGFQTLIHLIDQGEASIRGAVLTWSWEKWQN